MKENELNNTAQSPWEGLYAQFGVTTPLELSNKFTELDQEEMRRGEYDYTNSELPINQIKNYLETSDPSLLTDEENRWRNEMLWLWNHHATSMALFGRQDDEAARHFVGEALKYQAEDHPNKLTKLLQLLAEGDVVGAEQYVQAEIPPENVEYESGLGAIKMYKEIRLRNEHQLDEV